MAKEATDNEVLLDRISSLPDPILCHVLSFLPGKDAVRSSVLSSRWRYLFISTSTIDFDNYLEGLVWKNVKKFKNFVDRLFFYPNRISLDCFRVNDRWTEFGFDHDLSHDDYLRLKSWISAAIWRDVKDLDIHLGKKYPFKLPISLMTCQSLVTLKLDMNCSFDVPAKVCLPNLKTLHLKTVVSRGGSMHRLISGLRVLEDLVIRGCCFVQTSELGIDNLSLKRLVLYFENTLVEENEYYDFVIKINAPSLVYFQYVDVRRESYNLSTMNSLEKAEIRISNYIEVDREPGATQLIQGMCNVRSLSLTTPDFRGFETLPRRLLDGHIIFDNLVELRFEHKRADGIWKGRWLLEFLRCVPNLKTLILHLADTKGGIEVLLEEVPSCLWFHLKEITISNFKENECMFELIRYFLNNAIVLEKLVLGIEALSEKNQLSILKRLVRLPRKSMKCEVMTC